jgi:uncharacterized membrane protein
MLAKLVVYGCIGLLVETLFTGIKSALGGDKRARGHTYLWMLIVYAAGGIAIEEVRDLLIYSNMYLRGAVDVLIIFCIEYIAGATLKKILGIYVWKYTKTDSSEVAHRLSLGGHIRLDYAVYWYALAVAFDYYLPTILSRMA